MKLKQRMYFFVPYNISAIQQGIQAGHAALEYAHKYSKDQDFIDFIENDKTWIILNGGTTNSNLNDIGDPIGALNYIEKLLINNNIKHASFKEPDLNNALSAVCFLANEKAWDFENYPDFEYLMITNNKAETKKPLSYYVDTYPEEYTVWYENMTEISIKIRDIIRGKKLAQLKLNNNFIL